MRKMSKDVAPVGVFSGVPSFFKACCFEASRGGMWDYGHPAYELLRHVEELVPYEIDSETWENGPIAELGQHFVESDGPAILQWFCDHYPQCMQLIPKRRRKVFLGGLARAAQDFWGVESQVTLSQNM